MTPAVIIQRAAGDAVNLALWETGTIKAAGLGAAVNRWLSIIRDNKPGILAELTKWPAIVQAITNGAAEFFEERAAIAKFNGGLSHEEAEPQARQETERDRRECWERHQKAANYILSLPTWQARERALERYQQEKVAQYDEVNGEIMAAKWPTGSLSQRLNPMN
jgi:hypothetical protein